jgi:hypothetical protein
MTERTVSLRTRLARNGYSPARSLWRARRPRSLWKLTSPAGGPTLAFVERYGLTVRRGPFAGLRYPPAAVGHASLLAAKLLGSYEEELADIVSGLVASGFRRLINVGAGEGYYAVGFALGSPGTTVLAFEASRHQRALCRRIGAHNGVELTIGGTLTTDELRRLEIDAATLLIVDIEGHETELLDPELVPSLAHATLLVELHPVADARPPDLVIRRFEPTHELVLVTGRDRDPADYPEHPDPILVDEGRPRHQLWALITPRPNVVSN